MIFSDKQYIFKYDEDDNLCEYLEKDDGGNLMCAYNYSNNTLRKIYYGYTDDEEIYRETRSVTTYPDTAIMHHQFFDGTSRVVVREKNGNFVAPIKKIEKSDGLFTTYSVKPNLLQQWKITK